MVVGLGRGERGGGAGYVKVIKRGVRALERCSFQFKGALSGVL